MTRTIDVSDLPEPVVQAIESMVRTYREKVQEQAEPQPKHRPLGWAKGILPELPDSFFEPLPDDLLDLFEGRAVEVRPTPDTRDPKPEALSPKPDTRKTKPATRYL